MSWVGAGGVISQLSQLGDIHPPVGCKNRVCVCNIITAHGVELRVECFLKGGWGWVWMCLNCNLYTVHLTETASGGGVQSMLNEKIGACMR